MKPVCLGSRLAWSALAMLVVIAFGSQSAQSQFQQQRSVGGVAIDVDGVVSAVSVEDQRELAQVRETALAEVPADFSAFTELRGVRSSNLRRPLPSVVRKIARSRRKCNFWPVYSASSTYLSILIKTTSFWQAPRKVGGWTPWAMWSA